MVEEAPASDVTPTDAVGLASRIKHQIVLGAWGRVHNLEVTVSESRVSVRGRTPSHYIKQLVLQAVFDVIGPSAAIPVEFDIQVGRGGAVLPGDDDLWGVPRFRERNQE